MESIQEENSCKNTGCNCTAEIDSDYCNDRCRQAEIAHEMSCQCGHPDCCGPVS